MMGAVSDLGRERRLRALDEKMRAAVSESPRLAVRTATWLKNADEKTPLEGATEEKTMAAAAKTARLVLTLPQDLVDRAARLVPAMEQDVKVVAQGRVSRASVLRVAIAEGVELLEQRYGVNPTD